MANLIQIKRSQNTAVPTSLANGELAYSSNGNVFYIGDFGSVVAIGGERNPGILTANQALVANSTSYIDVVKTANLFIGTSSVNAINAIANVTHLGANANNELPTTWAVKTYVDSSIAYTITNNSSNTQLLFNDSGVVGGDAGITYNKNTDTLLVAGTLNVNNNVFANASGVTVNGFVHATSTVNASMLSVGTNFIANSTGAYHTGTVNAQSFTVGSNIVANSAGVYTTGTVNGSIISVGTAVVANLGGVYTTGTVNGSVLSVGSNVVANSTGLFTNGVTNTHTLSVYDTAVSSNTTTGAATVAGGLGVAGKINAGELAIGNTSVYSSLTGTTLTTGNVHATGTVNGSIVSVGSNVIANGSGVFTTGQVNASSLTVGDIFVANGTAVLANTDVTINGNTTIGSSSADTVSVLAEVSSNVIPSANATYNLGSADDRWNYVYAANVVSNEAHFSGDVSITGDLTVSGNVTTINVSSLSVADPVIKLAVNNSVSDQLWLGFTGHYNGQGNTTNHAGVARNPDDKEFYMFGTYADENLLVNENKVNTADPSFSLANLHVYLKSSGLITNGTHVAITANSTVNVSITANSITLTTPLAATSGGTGFNSYNSGDLLVANSSNVLSKLGLGTDGKILQSNGSALVYADLDGGVF